MTLKSISRIIFILSMTCLLSACSTQYNWWQSDFGQSEIGMDAGYQQGVTMPSHYRKADRTPPDYGRTRRQCVTDANGQQVCGYDCKMVAGYAKCASKAKMRCVTNPNGHITCGYDCKVTGSSAKCGKYLYDNCVSNHYGQIKCGNNCRVREDGEIVCGK